jgi:3',5'-cyclic AMP phosphodiesterase CpdA
MITLAHLSDVHLAPLPPVRVRELMGKRITGFVNWRLRRQRSLGGEGLASLVEHLKAQHPDITAVTGDLVNLALDDEIDAAGQWLRALGGPDKVCVCPGNHDAYVRGQLEKALRRWDGYVAGETIDRNPFPFVRRLGEVAVVSCSSAIHTAPGMAFGRFDEAQALRLNRILELLGTGGYFRVVLIHHPPNVEARNLSKGLYGARLFRDAVARHGAELILHGHSHQSSIFSIPGPQADVPVVGVAAAGTAQSD